MKEKNIFEQGWSWVNGHKTTIGALLMAFLAETDIIPGNSDLHPILERVAQILVGAGLTHKAVKFGARRALANPTAMKKALAAAGEGKK